MSEHPPIHVDRKDRTGRIRFMVRSGGYVMVRRPHFMPFVLPERKWMNLPAFDQEQPK